MNEHYNYMTKYPEYKQSDRGVTMNVKKTLVPMISCFVIAFCLFYISARPLSEYGSVSPRGPIVSRVTIEPTGDNEEGVLLSQASHEEGVLFSAKQAMRRGYFSAKQAMRRGYFSAKQAMRRGYFSAKQAMRRGYFSAKQAMRRGYFSAKQAMRRACSSQPSKP